MLAPDRMLNDDWPSIRVGHQDVPTIRADPRTIWTLLTMRLTITICLMQTIQATINSTAGCGASTMAQWNYRLQ